MFNDSSRVYDLKKEDEVCHVTCSYVTRSHMTHRHVTCSHVTCSHVTRSRIIIIIIMNYSYGY